MPRRETATSGCPTSSRHRPASGPPLLEIQHPPREESLAAIVTAMDVAAEHELPVVVVRHEAPAGSPVFAAGSTGRYMTNNCVIGTAAAAEDLGIAVEVLSDATGAIDIVNEAGSASARQVHETLMALLHSNFAAVATTAAWTSAVEQGQVLTGSNLGVSAVQGRAAYDATR